MYRPEARALRLIAATVAVVGAAAALVASCGVVSGSGTTVTRDLALSGFSKVDARSGFEVSVRHAEAHAVSMAIDDALSEYLDVEIDGDTLRLGLDTGTGYRDATLRAVVEMPALEALQLSGASAAEVVGFEGVGVLRLDASGDSSLRLVALRSGAADLSLSGSSEAEGDWSCATGAFDLSGGSRARLAGSARELSLAASGGSTFALTGFRAERAAVELSGSSEAVIEVAGVLDADLSGDSRLEYLGAPRLGSITTSGGSAVRRATTPSPRSSGAASPSPAAVTPPGGGWSAVALGDGQIGAVSFVDARRGWAASRGLPADKAADDGLWRTDDGGDSWSPLSKIKLRDVCFVDRLNGWGLSAQGVRPELLRSADGGATWQARPIDERPEWLYQVRFVDARHGFIAAGQYGSRHGGWVLTTADGGRAWRARKVADTPIKAACFIDRLEGWAIGDQDIVHTGDGGRSWTVQLHRDNGAVHGSDIWFVDARHGWAVGEAPGRVWMTADGGRTWRVVWRGDEITLNAIRFADASTGWAVGTRYPADDEDGDAASVTGSSSTGVVLKTADGGATWRQQRFIDVSELFDVALAGREALVVAGSAAVVRRPL